jgi:hypothetical protein
VSRNRDGYMVQPFWSRDGVNWGGGYGEGSPLPLATAHQMAERFVNGQSVPDDLGGFDYNKPEEIADD